MTEKFSVRMNHQERKYVRIYHDFLHNTVLSADEKLVYIALKSYVDFTSDSGEVFPSMATLCRDTSLSENTVRKAIKGLKAKKIIDKKQRGLTKSNLYILSDNSQMWHSETAAELADRAENEAISLSTEEMLAELQRRGVIEIVEKEAQEANSDQNKEKDPVSLTDQSLETEPKHTSVSENTNSSFHAHNTFNRAESQEEYTLDDVKDQIDYDYLKQNHPSDPLIDSITMMLYDRLNTTSDTIRVSGEQKSTAVVKSVLRKVGYSEVLHTIEQYNKITDRINQSESYLFTILYKSPMQQAASFQNYFNRTYFGDSPD